MKTINRIKQQWLLPWQAISITLLIFLAQAATAQVPPGYNPLPTPLDSWSFNDSSNWTDDDGNYPIGFTNIAWSQLGDGSSLVVETNVPAWLNYPIYETSKFVFTNLVVNGPGSVCFWYGPGWSTTNGGPNQWAQLIDAGEWTPDSSVGYWGLSVDPSGSNLWFLAQDGAGNTYSLSAPIDWTTNDFQFIALTYSATNVSIYLNGQLMTNDPGGLSIWPDSAVLANGVYFGSDESGNFLANGLFDTVQSYNFPLDSNTVNQIYEQQLTYFEISPWNIPYMDALSSAGSNPSTNTTDPNAITGSGYLQWDGTAANCSYSGSPFTVWITNLVAIPAGGGTMNETFSIDGGESGYLYDVFATSALETPLTNAVWGWMGQGMACNTYTITNIPSPEALLILGTPYDPETNNLTAAYSSLILHLDPYIYDQDGSGLSDGAQVLLGLDPLINQVGQPGTSSLYCYTRADWIYRISGVKSTSYVITDPEGNVTSVSQ